MRRIPADASDPSSNSKSSDNLPPPIPESHPAQANSQPIPELKRKAADPPSDPASSITEDSSEHRRQAQKKAKLDSQESGLSTSQGSQSILPKGGPFSQLVPPLSQDIHAPPIPHHGSQSSSSQSQSHPSVKSIKAAGQKERKSSEELAVAAMFAGSDTQSSEEQIFAGRAPFGLCTQIPAPIVEQSSSP